MENSADLADPLFCKCTPVELKSALQPSGWKEYSVLGGVDWCQTARHLEGGRRGRRGRLLTMILYNVGNPTMNLPFGDGLYQPLPLLYGDLGAG